MLGGFWESLGGKLGEDWAARLLTPAVVFWGGGLAAWGWGHENGWSRIGDWASRLETTSSVLQVGALVAILLGVVVSGFVVERLSLFVLRLLEGYWPRSWNWLVAARVRRLAPRLKKDRARFQVLAPKQENNSLTAEEQREFDQIDRRLRGLPADQRRFMPTKLGNVLRAAEDRPGEKYGLNSIVCWPRLWLLLPKEVKEELSEARSGLDLGAQTVLWAVLFLVWTYWAWWAAPAGVLVALFAYRWMLGTAGVYAALFESTFDLFRFALYEALRWPLPANPADERARGALVTTYLVRGSAERIPEFVGTNERADKSRVSIAPPTNSE